MVAFANRAWVNSTATSSASSITLGTALSGYQTFAAAGIVNGDTVHYVIVDGANWEIGTGVYTSAGTLLSRTPIESSNADARISLSGSSTIFIDQIANDIVKLDAAQTWSAVQGYAETALTWVGTATSSWDVSLAPCATLTASNGNTDMGAPTNVTAGRFYSLRFAQGATPRTITWSSSFKFIDGTAPSLSQGNGDVDHFIFYGRASNVLEEVGRAQAVA